MPKLPIVSGRKIVKALQKAGFEIVGRRGSHIRLKKREGENVFIVVVPDHPEVASGTFLSIIRQSGMKKEEFLKLLEKL
ncbi:MAG TPA: addiction module toxin, HicA family [Thermoplasmata archaeon]|nr:addiction module toxin, HicA family [Thermoplasmata archaeon]